MVVLTLVFGMTVVGCNDDSTDDNSGGTFVLTDIPAVYNGKYAYFEARNYNTNVSIHGCKSINMSTETITITLVQILNGKVSLPMWIYDDSSDSIKKYSGNDTFTQDDNCSWGVAIFNTATLTEEIDETDETDGSEYIATIYFTGSIIFNNGSAEKSVNTGTIFTD